MTGALLAVLLSALPEGSARYRLELGGVPVGAIELSVECGEARCRARWESRKRLPAEAGGELQVERFEREVDREGREVSADGPRPPPAFLLELLLRDAGAAERCLDVAEERTGRRQRGCGRAEGGGEVRIALDGEEERVRYAADGFPERIELPAQRTRFVRAPAAAAPDAPPRLWGVEVPGPAEEGQGARFCGVTRNAAATAGDAGAARRLPPPRAPGANCREQAAAWVEAARAAGHEARTAVGIAWSGAGWSWHAWAEAQVGARWIAVDPAFAQSPARSPRFTLATFGPGDEAGRQAAGRRILGCWGRAAVEP